MPVLPFLSWGPFWLQLEPWVFRQLYRGKNTLRGFLFWLIGWARGLFVQNDVPIIVGASKWNPHRIIFHNIFLQTSNRYLKEFVPFIHIHVLLLLEFHRTEITRFYCALYDELRSWLYKQYLTTKTQKVTEISSLIVLQWSMCSTFFLSKSSVCLDKSINFCFNFSSCCGEYFLLELLNPKICFMYLAPLANIVVCIGKNLLEFGSKVREFWIFRRT